MACYNQYLAYFSAAERDRASRLSHTPRYIPGPYGHENVETSFEKSLSKFKEADICCEEISLLVTKYLMDIL